MNTIVAFLLFFSFFLDADPLLIIGCGRSGTAYMANILSRSGYDIRHERFGKDGCVSWPMVVDVCSIDGSSPNEGFLHTFHQVRHPLAVMTSWYVNLKQLDGDEWNFIRNHIPEIKREDSLLIHCAKYWYYWNLLAERKAEWRYQIEKIRETTLEFFQRSGIAIDLEWISRSKTDINSWKKTKKKFTWKDLNDALPADLYANIREMAIRYGYDD